MDYSLLPGAAGAPVGGINRRFPAQTAVSLIPDISNAAGVGPLSA